MSQEQQVLKWGDLIRIHGVSTNPQKQSKGLIISKGFTDPNVYYQTYQTFNEVNFYRESLFQVMPKSNFDLHDQLQTDQTLTPQQRDALRQRARQEISQLEGGLESKSKDKQANQITYGAEVVFKHIQSGQYLSGVLKAADIGEGAFKLELAKQLSSFLIFKLISHRSYQNQGNKIYYDDCLRIHHVKTDCYMNFPDTDISIIFDRPYDVAIFQKEDKGFEYADNRPSIKKPVKRRINVINENKSKCLWKFIQHCSHEQSKQKQKIKSHDIVYFQHTKNKGLIASTLARQKYYLKQTNNSSSQQVVSYECFWELIPKQVNQNGPQKCNTFWARNIVTGQILTFNDFKVEIQSKEEVDGGGFKSEGLVNLICSQKGQILQSSGFPMQNIKSNEQSKNVQEVLKYFDQKINKIQFKAVEQLSQDSFIIVRVPEQTILDVSYVLSSQQSFVKVVQIISTELKKKTRETEEDWKNMFLSLNEDLLVSFISVLKLLAGKIYGTSYEDIEASGNSPILQIQKILVQTGIAQLLIQIVFNLYDPFKFIDVSKAITEDRAIRNKIVQIFELSYILLQKIVKDFLENKIYFSRWIKLFLFHSNNINKSYIQECLVCILQNNPVSIKAMVTEQQILSLIKFFLQEADEDRAKGRDLTTKHLRLFSTFIRGDNIIFKENQKIILNSFFNNQENIKNIFKFKVQYRIADTDQISDQIHDKQKNKVIKMSFGGQDYCTIPQFFEQNLNKFNYFISYIHLLADVCMDRNNQAIEYVENNLPLSVVALLLFDPDIAKLNETLKSQNLKSEIKRFSNTNIHDPFIRIGHHAYVNNMKFSPIQRIRKIVKWYKFQDEKQVTDVEDITKTKRVYEGEKEEEEKSYLNYLLIYIQDFLTHCDKEISNLQILHTVLNFLKQTILLGLWESIDKFRLIIPLLIKNITKIQSSIFFDGYEDAKNRYSGKQYIDLNKQKLKMNRPEIALIIDCKIKATQIFKYINEMEIDIRLRYMMNFFQGIYQASENFQIYNQPIEDDHKKEETDEKTSLIVNRNQSAKQQFYKIIGSNILGEIKKLSEDQDIMLKENIWYNKIRTMIPLDYQPTQQPDKDRDLFKHSSDYKLQIIVLSLFELSGYFNKNLLNSSLNMLRAMFQQRQDLIQNYKHLLICGKGNLNQVYANLKFMRNKFAMLKNDTILKYDGNASKSFAYAIFKPYDHLGRQEDKRSGIIQDLFFLARTLKDNVSLKNIESLMHVEKEVFDKRIVYHFYNEREKNNSLFQQLNMAEGIYDPLLQYIKIVGNKEIDQIHRWLLFSIYQYLTLLCFNNMKAKHIFMNYIPYILPHLNKRVGAASFLYEVCINNKILVNSEELVVSIIDGALNACLSFEPVEIEENVVKYALALSPVPGQDISKITNYEKSRILYSLRGILIFNDEGHKRNQQLLMNKLQDNKFRKLIIKDEVKLGFIGKKQDFNLIQSHTYVTTHFELFSAMVESQNLINIGKLENLHKYPKLLAILSTNNRWQIRRAVRSYINRLYYVHKDKDIFLFEQFIRNEFRIIDGQFKDLIDLHKSKMLSEDLKVKNGIRFVYAQSEITLLVLQILITLHQIFLKSQFIKILKRQLAKQQKYEDNARQLHLWLIKLLKNLGRIGKLYHNAKTIVSFVREIKKLMDDVLITFHVRYLQKKSEPNAEQKELSEQKGEKSTKPKDQPEVKKGFIYDNSKTFFRNLVGMIKSFKNEKMHQELKEKYLKQKNVMDVSQNDLKKRYIDSIFSVPGENLKPINAIKIKEQEEQHYKPHLSTANSKIFKVLAKPQLQQNQENLELNNRLNNVKQLLSDSPAFKKLRQDEFYKLVGIFNKMDENSSDLYSEDWKKVDEDPRPVFSKVQIIKNCFQLIINNPDQVNDEEKIFIIKLVRCYISEAVQEKQSHKLSVDKWNADYYTDQQSSADLLSEQRTELVKRQHEIEVCGGSRLLLSIFKQNLFTKTELLNEALLLGIVYLFNGNTYCQNSILKELKKDFSNSALVSIKNLIKNIGKFLIQVRKIQQNQKKRSFSYKIIDSYDHFDTKQNILVKLFGHKTDKFQIQTELNYEMALCRMFRFLQLFCENNNIEMKKFIMTQTNNDDTPKINTINFISEACYLLRQFFKIMSSKIVSIPPSLLDFINQITQIPCLDCQKSLMRSTFFEDISYMAGSFESKENIEQRKFSVIIEKASAEQGQSEEENPLETLLSIYQKSVGLALSNFEGNNDEIFWEFLNKCQPRFLWIVMRQNIIKLLRNKAEGHFRISRNEIETELQKEYLESEENKQAKRAIFVQYRQYLVEYAFVRAIFNKFDERQILLFIKEERAKGKVFNKQICNIINVLAILRKINDYSQKRKKEAIADPENINIEQSNKALKAFNFKLQLIEKAEEDQYPHIKDFLNIFESLVLSIEISSNNGEVDGFQNLYFPNHPVFSYLASDTRDNIMFEVGRQTRRDKLVTLFEHYDELKEEIQWNYDLKYYTLNIFGLKFPVSITSQLIDRTRKVARYISYTIIALMMYFIIINHDKVEQASYFDFFNYKQKIFMKAICIIQLLLTLLFFSLWIKMRLNLCLSKYKKSLQEQVEGAEAEAEQVIQDDSQPPAPVTRLEKVFYYTNYLSNSIGNASSKFTNLCKSIHTTFFERIITKYGFRHIAALLVWLFSPIFKVIKSFGIAVYALNQYESGFLSILVFVITSIVSNIYGIQWYTLHIFQFFVGISLLTNVFKAILQNIKDLTLLSAFAGCFILVFNILSLNTYTPVIYEDDIPAQACQNVIGCVLQVYTSGAIGDDMDELYVGRFFFDTLYVVFMEMLFQNLVGGMMIDTFGGLKQADAARDEDKKSKCYICAMEKPDMEKAGTTFKKHTEKHWLWNYLFYRYCVNMKDPSDYTGLEYTISTQLEEQKVQWFPDNGPKEEGGEVQSLMGNIKVNTHELNKKINDFLDKNLEYIKFSSKAIKKAIQTKVEPPHADVPIEAIEA